MTLHAFGAIAFGFFAALLAGLLALIIYLLASAVALALFPS